MKTVVITGAARGLGRELLSAYDAQGWRTVPVVRDEEVALRLREECSPSNCQPIVADLADPDTESGIRDTLAPIGTVDLLINNAGIPGRSTGLFDSTPDEVTELLDIHVVSALRVCRAVVPWMLNADGPKIINISSRLGSIEKSAAGEFSGKGFSYSYRIAKAAQNMLSVCLSEEFAKQGVQVAAVHPGQFMSSTASSGADMSAGEAASELVQWIESLEDELEVQFAQPGQGTLPW